MEFFLRFEPKKIAPSISYSDKIMLTGSCFTEHIGNALADLKFSIIQNPNGILFAPDAVSRSLTSYVLPDLFSTDQLFYLNETWNSWHHHSRFSNIGNEAAIKLINSSQIKAHDFLRSADWLIITLGSSYTYELTEHADPAGKAIGETVANCHRAPASWFTKKMLTTAETLAMFEETLSYLSGFNPGLKYMFTISPVRHARDGVVENNRSKARLIDAVHSLIESNDKCYYFPAYELVIDVLRDYRFYDIDLVHPNYAATSYVFEKFVDSCFDLSTKEIMQEIRKINIAKKHRPLHPETSAHSRFMDAHLQKVNDLKEKYPLLDLQDEILWFSGNRNPGS